MIRYTTGNLLTAQTKAFVNTVNIVGVMGKGIALQFKDTFPHNFSVYAHACRTGELVVGKMLVVNDSHPDLGDRIIINFPTKKHWRYPSRYEYVEEGLKDLRRVIISYGITSIAIPPLGCGNGGLDWDIVKSLIEKYLVDLLYVDIIVYQPGKTVAEDVKRTALKRNKMQLTPADAMLLYSLFYYESLGENCSLFVANKLAYFLQILGEPLFSDLHFKAHIYGPYSVQVGHILHKLNGEYIKGLEQMEAKAFEPLELQYARRAEVSDYVHNELNDGQREILKRLINIISGYQSTLSLEILASVAYIRRNNPNIDLAQTIDQIHKWSARKEHLFKEKYIDIAFQHLNSFSSILNIK